MSFAFETTLASRTFAPWLNELKAQGYDLHLIFLWLPSENVALARVADRVAGGGHNVPAETVRRRYHKGVRNFFRLYAPIASTWRFYKNSDRPPVLVAVGGDAQETLILDALIWESVRRQGFDDEI